MKEMHCTIAKFAGLGIDGGRIVTINICWGPKLQLEAVTRSLVSQRVTIDEAGSRDREGRTNWK